MLDGITERELIRWLQCHEDDIARGIEDFDDLRNVYEAYMGKPAQMMLRPGDGDSAK